MKVTPLIPKMRRFLSYSPRKKLRSARAWFRRALIKARFRIYPHKPAIAGLGWGKFEIINDWIGINVFDGSYDQSTLKCLSHLLNRDSVFLDAGANLGYYSIYIEKHCACRIFAFEPSPREFARLSRNLYLNHSRDIKAEQLGLGDRIHRAEFFISNLNTGANSLIRHSAEMERIEIDVITLDSYVESSGINRIDLLKIDVEGSEYAVLKGSGGVIDRFRPAVFYETWQLPGKPFSEVRRACPATDFLYLRGYKFYVIDDDAIPHKLDDDMGADGTTLLAIHRGGLEEWR